MVLGFGSNTDRGDNNNNNEQASVEVGCHTQKSPIILTYRRGVLISSSASHGGTAAVATESTDNSSRTFKPQLEIAGGDNDGGRESPACPRKLKLRNSNSLEICASNPDFELEGIDGYKGSRKLSLPADFTKLDKVHFDEAEMASTSNGHVRSHNHSTTNAHHSKIPRQQKEYISGFALLEACQMNTERKVKDLVRKMCCMSSAEVGPLVNFQDQTGRTALSFACAIGNITIIEELTKLRRLDPNLGDNDGNTPLHYAAQAGQSAAVDLLLLRFDGIIDPNCRNSTGLSPLHKAALQGRSRVAKSLIVAGASPYQRDFSRNMTPMEWARLCGRHICAEVIVRCARDNQCPSVGSPPAAFNSHRTFPVMTSQSAMELKRMNSDDSPYYHLQNARNTISGANWLKNKIRKALGSSSPPTRSESSYALMSNLGGATLCAGSLILPSIKPILDQQKPKIAQKMKIPTVQVTPVNKR